MLSAADRPYLPEYPLWRVGLGWPLHPVPSARRASGPARPGPRGSRGVGARPGWPWRWPPRWTWGSTRWRSSRWPRPPTGPGYRVTYTQHDGQAPATPPAHAVPWTVQASGTGRQTLEFDTQRQGGDQVAVVMNADGSRSVSGRAESAVTRPSLPWIASDLLAGESPSVPAPSCSSSSPSSG